MSVERVPGESDEYRKLCGDLLDAERALRDQRERVAALRRQLPPGPCVPDYEFQEGDGESVQLSELFGEHNTLLLVHFMYGGAQENPCPMCSMWADGYDAVARHVCQRAAFALAAEAPIEKLRAWAQLRGWQNLRLLSSAGTSFKTDLKMQDPDGAQHPGLSVFTRGSDGSVRHHYTVEALLAPGEWRGGDLLSPVWHLFDLTPEGRGDWFPSLEYD
jgi:predicted dithiol-disulfide oxidoreductase (DUF899 family)